MHKICHCDPEVLEEAICLPNQRILLYFDRNDGLGAKIIWKNIRKTLDNANMMFYFFYLRVRTDPNDKKSTLI